jgi:hypothetical protein
MLVRLVLLDGCPLHVNPEFVAAVHGGPSDAIMLPSERCGWGGPVCVVQLGSTDLAIWYVRGDADDVAGLVSAGPEPAPTVNLEALSLQRGV